MTIISKHALYTLIDKNISLKRFEYQAEISFCQKNRKFYLTGRIHGPRLPQMRGVYRS